MSSLINNNENKYVKTDNTIIHSNNEIKKCTECNEFFGLPDTDHKCSYCFKGKDKVLSFRDPEFKKMLDEYVKSKLVNKTQQNLLKKSLKKKTSGPFRYIIGIIMKEDKYISAKFGYELKMKLNNIGRSEKETKILSLTICSLIIDWWNMKNYSFNSMEMCYFGHFGDNYEINEIKTIPPPLNNRLIDSSIFKNL
tara:strand:+ start:1034 stop:1618 length:585 start_codon:yes stop_codon:yes gene_type:complete